MSKYLPTILLIISAVAGAFSGQIQHVVSAHPALFTSVASVLSVVLHWLPSPSNGA